MKLEEAYKTPQPWDLEIRFKGLYESEVLINGKPLEDVERIELVSQWGEPPTLHLRMFARDKDGKPVVCANIPARIDAEALFSGVLKGKFESWKT